MRKMEKEFYGTAFKIARFFVRPFFPKYKSFDTEKAIAPAVYISHHQNLYGPMMSMLWFPKAIHIWWLYVFQDKDTCYDHFMKFTFTERFGWSRWRARLVSFPLSRIVAMLFKSCQAIPVYRKSRNINKTFELSVDALIKGEPVLIFPDVNYQSDADQMGEMYKGFLHLERYYHEKTGKHIPFVPLHIDKETQSLSIDEPVYFRDGVSFRDDVDRVYEELRGKINHLAEVHEQA